MMFHLFCLIWFFPSHQQSFSYKGTAFLGWTSSKLGVMFLLKDKTQWRRNAPTRGPSARVKHPTTEPLWCKSKVVLLAKGYLSILQIYRQSGLWKCTKVDLKSILECRLLNSSAADFVNYYFTNVNMEANSVDPDQNILHVH